jgi:hypothetical protein
MREQERLAGRKAPGTTDPAGTIRDEGDGFWKDGLDVGEGGRPLTWSSGTAGAAAAAATSRGLRREGMGKKP